MLSRESPIDLYRYDREFHAVGNKWKVFCSFVEDPWDFHGEGLEERR
jgi:hypothetical protein